MLSSAFKPFRLTKTLIPLTIVLSSRCCPARSFSPPVTHTSNCHNNRPSSSTAVDTCSSNLNNMVATDEAEEDPYLWLEEVESEEALNFAKQANDACLTALGDPSKSGTGTYDRILAVLDSDDRIPYSGKFGYDENGNELLFNFWKDANHVKGIWRKTTMQSFRTEKPEWITVLDIDKLAEEDGVSWVWKGSRPLPRDRDPMSEDGKRVTRALINLSRAGADATVVKEFDLLTGDFVPNTENPFYLPEAKSRVSWRSRDVLIVGTDTGPDSLTDSGYPRTVREWVRGTELKDAPVVFEGEKTDVSTFAYIDDQRPRNGPIYEVRGRSITFYSSQHFARIVEYEHLLAPDDPLRQTAGPEPEFVEVAVQEDASIDFVGKWMLVDLRSDWEPKPGEKFIQGSIVYVDARVFLEKGPEACEYHVLFKPTLETASEYYTCTQNYLILNILDNVKSRVEFYKLGDDKLELVGGDTEGQIRDVSISPIDPREGDRFWFTTSGFLQPSTLHVADAALVEKNGGSNGDSFVVDKLKSLPDQFDTSNLVSVQEYATSKDGTKVPYFLIKRSDTKLDGKNPTLMYGYGGFEISLGPHYVATAGLAWLERGGVYVEANIRGGGEYGARWHQAAKKENRNKSYEDFIAIAEDLVSKGYCRPSTLAIRGGSNGGLLMGNMYTMRPDLFGAIHCAVPLLDMKRYTLLLAGASWAGEFGDPKTEDWENYLHKYSPYHNIDTSVEKYPAMLVTTSTRDDRVHPGHARKMVKKLWDLGKDKDWPVYYYENIEGGHGGASNNKQSAFMLTLAYDFMFSTLTKNAEEL